jgi:hypothetical protein
MTRIPKSRSEVFPHPRPQTPDALWPAPRLGIRGLRNCVSRSWTLRVRGAMAVASPPGWPVAAGIGWLLRPRSFGLRQGPFLHESSIF